MPTISISSSGDPTQPDQVIIFGEDDIDDIDFLKETFSAVGEKYALNFIDKGRKLIDALAALPDHQLPCLLVLDYNMPELNGAEILAILKQDPRYDHIPKIIWSTSGSDTYKNICLELGATDYVIKPGNVKGLMETASYLLSFCKNR